MQLALEFRDLVNCLNILVHRHGFSPNALIYCSLVPCQSLPSSINVPGFPIPAPKSRRDDKCSRYLFNIIAEDGYPFIKRWIVEPNSKYILSLLAIGGC